jgi:flagellar basal body-associated protein FliL
LDDTKVAAAQKKRRWFQRIAIAVVSVLIIVSVSTAVFWYSKYSYQREFDDEFILVIEPPVEGTLEEFWAAKEQEAQFNGGK